MKSKEHCVARRRARKQETCRCQAYPFAHRMFGGKCRGEQDWLDEPIYENDPFFEREARSMNRLFLSRGYY